MTTGEKIQYYRKQRNMSQEQLGQMLLVSRQTVSLWEKDQTTPTIDNLLRLKEIFDVSADDLLSEDRQPDEVRPQKKDDPAETFSVCYRKDDIRRAVWGAHKKRMTRMTVITGILTALFVLSLTNHDIVTSGFSLGCVICAVILTGMNYLKLKGAIRISEQQTSNTVYHYDVYENYLEQIISRNGEKVATRKIQFSELTDIRQFGDLIVFRYAGQMFLMHSKDVKEDSRFYRFLRSHINEKQKPKRKGGA